MIYKKTPYQESSIFKTVFIQGKEFRGATPQENITGFYTVKIGVIKSIIDSFIPTLCPQ